MSNQQKFYIDGAWVNPLGDRTLDVHDPSTEAPIATIALGNAADVDRAVAAARRAFESYSRTSVADRLALLDKITAAYQSRLADLGRTISQEMGSPIAIANTYQAPLGLAHLMNSRAALEQFSFEERERNHSIVREPVGVCGLITPWNWPMNQSLAKLGPALATGCTVVLKPSELAPLSSLIVAEIMHDAGVPAGVFNLVNGDGPTVGVAMASHPDIDMISITGSTRAGVSVAEHAAKTVKRVTQELGGKSPNIILEGANFAEVITRDVFVLCLNSGQNCNAPTRMLVPKARMDEAAAIAKAAAEMVKVGVPGEEATQMGPVAHAAQFDKIQSLIQKGIDEGAKLETGGLGRPAGFERGYYVKPTIFSHVSNDMTIARQEIFGPVLCLIGYENEEDAIRIANDTVYGLCAYVSAADLDTASRVARRLRAGSVHLNGAQVDVGTPFGGYKQSGNGREFGRWALEEYLETKAILGCHP
jgi:aldehyde dehydrogenase (NAD+)